ncbi:MAG: hypothetical protein QM747_01145 [Nocardioides sp.]
MSTRRREHRWYDSGWWALAGLVSGAGLIAGTVTVGPLVLVVTFVAMGLAIGPTVWSILDQMDRPEVGTSLRIATASAWCVTVAVGLFAGLHVWATPVLALTVVTSPTVLRPLLARATRAARDERERAEVARLRQDFDEIIAYGFTAHTGDDERGS